MAQAAHLHTQSNTSSNECWARHSGGRPGPAQLGNARLCLDPAIWATGPRGHEHVCVRPNLGLASGPDGQLGTRSPARAQHGPTPRLGPCLSWDSPCRGHDSALFYFLKNPFIVVMGGFAIFFLHRAPNSYIYSR